MPVDEHTIEVAGSPLYYRAASPGATPTLYLHGVPTSSDDWVPFLERTGGVAPDLMGFGRSGKGGHLDYSIEGLTEFVERVVDQLVGDRLHIVAHDWGAAPALVFAQRHRERVARLVLCNALPLLDGFQWPRLARWWRRRLIGEFVMGSTTRGLLARALRGGCVNPEAWSSQQLAAVWEHFDQGTQRAILRLYRSADEPRLAAAGKELGELRFPSLVIWGQRDPWIHASFGDAYARSLPQARLERVQKAGHWPWLDDPRVVERVAAFLDEAE